MFADLPLAKINPFRLVAASFEERRLCEWRWDGERLTCSRYGWKRKHWFSSGYDEALGNKKRSAVVREAAKPTPTGMRKLHQSHLPAEGPFSICMHRKDAKTVSYTEIVAIRSDVTMRYAAGSPCTGKLGAPRLLSLTSGT